MPHSRALRYGNWLGLAAMCLLLLGPLLGQGLARSSAELQWLDELACSSDHKAPQQQPHVGDWAKCGYCTLLLSSPALARMGFALPPLCTGHSVARSLDVPAPPPADVFPGAQPRAPPSQT
nr:DUF2946 family protein [uncultured Pseudomonas sp.]